ncbi:MAG: DUF748 domain-containing protein [Rhodocyclales bacterium GT-UBC]|nr:MAG: DUF748 domain-containing protein [Rhodocyclales bacterium GT-UBC]
MTQQQDLKSIHHRLGEVARSPYVKRFGRGLVIFLLVFGVLGYFAAPPLLKSVLLDQLSHILHRQVSIEKIEISPYALSAKVSGVSISGEDGKEVAGFDELFVNLSAASIFKMAAVIDEIRLQGPRLALTRLADGRYDISDLLDEWMKPSDEPDSPLPRFSLNNIQIVGGKVNFDDRPEATIHRLSDINLSLPFISSLPYQADILVEPRFSATIDDSQLLLEGRSKPFAGSHESELGLDLDQFDLGRLQAYLPDSFPLRLRAGKLDSELKIVFKESNDHVFSLVVLGQAHVSGLALSEAGGQPLLGWKRLDVEIDKADLLNRQFAIKTVLLDGLEANLSVSRQGEFNILMLADKLGRPSGDAKPLAATPETVWSLGEFVLQNGLVHWHDLSKQTPVVGVIRDLNVHVGSLDSRLAKPIEIVEASYQADLGERFRLERMIAKGVRIDLAAHRIDIAEVVNRQTRARMLRKADGQIEWVGSPVLKTIRATDEKVADEKPWIGTVDKLSIEDLAFRFEDQAVSPAAVQELDGFSLHGEHLTNEPGKAGTLGLKGKVNKKGDLRVDGKVQIMPLDVALKVETVAIPVMPLQPYFGEQLNIALARGQVSNKGELSAQIDKDGLKAGYKGSMTLGDFLAVDRVNSADFLKWKSLYFGAVDLGLQPMRIQIGEIALSDFYSRLILNQSGRLNLQDILRRPAAEAERATQPAAPVVEAKASGKAPLPIKIAKITLQNGTVNFSDFFVKPNYSVNITRLGGRVTGLSSTENSVADMDLRGSYANSAPVQIVGRLNPLAAKSYLDVKADITGVDLVGLSPYAGKYAGYNIEKGKLSLNLAYKLENNQLSADNRLFIDQFTFGEKVDSPDATTLPVNLAISLLKNNRGEIDLNLPISGSLDDPQFSVGGLIVKVVVNLFVKAVTSPFAMLGSMFGNGEELSSVEFAPGRVAISAAAVRKLEALGKALVERSRLKLEITGLADPDADKEGIKRVAIERLVKAEKLKDVLGKNGEGNSLDSIEIAADEYKTYLTRAYKEARFPKPRNVIGLQKELPVEEMEKLMLANQSVSDEDIRTLAARRAEAVQGWLVEQGKVPVERIFLLPPKRVTDEKSQGGRVDFSLR